MAFQNEEDYLDSLLKSLTENKDSAPVEELSDIYSELQIPEAFEPEVYETEGYETPLYDMEVPETEISETATFDFVQDNNLIMEEMENQIVEDENVFQEDLLDEVNPMAAMFESNMAQNWQEMTVGDVLVEQGVIEPQIAATAEVKTEEAVEEQIYVEDNIDPSEDELIDDYIQKVLNSDDEETTEYIDLTEDEPVADNDLLGKLDGIFQDVENEMQYMTKEAAEQNIIEEPQEQGISFSDLEVDDELKELLGVDEEEPQEIAEEIQGFSEEELKKLDEIQAESVIEENPQDEVMPVELFEQETDDGGIEDLLAMAEEAGIKTVEEVSEDTMEMSVDEVPENIPVVTEEKKQVTGEKKKQGFFAKILGLFSKKKQERATDAVNENQQVLDELFDENGELLGEEKKVTKKGLFSKSKKNIQGAVETPIVSADFGADMEEISDLEEISEVPKKVKKEKKKKEPKPKKVKEKKAKKPKKPKKPKPVKVKAPVNPADLIKIKPGVVFLLMLVIAGITGYIYFSVSAFSYNQALDSATFYLVEKKYTFAYEAIAGIEPKREEDIALAEQIETIMYVQKHYNSYERYVKMGMEFEALDSLIKGIKEYDTYYAYGVELGISADLDNVRMHIVNALQKYGITESMARSYGAITDYVQYVYILESYGGLVNDSNN